MLAELRKIIPAGFVFGLLFALVAHIVDFELYGAALWLMPFATALLCGLGAVVGSLVTSLLEPKGLHPRVVHIMSFAAAAFVNVGLVLLFFSYFGVVALQQEVLLGIVVGLAAGAVYGIYLYTMERMQERMQFLEALAENNRRLQEASRKLAIVEERNRMGRELHDSVSQGLHALIYSIHSLRNEYKEPTSRFTAILDHMEATASSTLDELRTMIEELRPSLLAERGLQEALQITVDLFAQRQEIPAEFDFKVPHDSVAPEIEMAIYRVAQEALANIERHAGARHVLLRVAGDRGRLTMTIRDDGHGFDSRQTDGGNGLRNMRQRVEEVSGTFQVVSRPNLGTTITAEFTTKG